MTAAYLPVEIWHQILLHPNLEYPDICNITSTCRDALLAFPKQRAIDTKVRYIVWSHPRPLRACMIHDRNLLGPVIKAGRQLTTISRQLRRSTLPLSTWLDLTIGELASICRGDSYKTDVKVDAKDIVLGYLRACKYLHAYVFVTLHESMGTKVVNCWLFDQDIYKTCFLTELMHCGVDAFIFFHCALASAPIRAIERVVPLLPQANWPADAVDMFISAFRLATDKDAMQHDEKNRPRHSDVDSLIYDCRLLPMFRWMCSMGVGIRSPTSSFNAKFLAAGWIEGLCCFGRLEIQWFGRRHPLKPYVKALSPSTSYEGLVTLMTILGTTPSSLGSVRPPRISPVSPFKFAHVRTADQLMLDWLTFDSEGDDVWDALFRLLEHGNFIAFQQLWLKVGPLSIPESKVTTLIAAMDTIQPDPGTRDILLDMLMMVE